MSAAHDIEERRLYEDAMYGHYITTRARRKAKGQGVANDTELPRPRDELFERTERGDYVAIVYQAAWWGWTLGRAQVRG